MYIQNAFLHGQLKEEIFMMQPEGCDDGTMKVCKLNKTLYELKQSPRAWNEEFVKFIKSIGLTQSVYDKCLFFKSKTSVYSYLLLYVDVR